MTGAASWRFAASAIALASLVYLWPALWNGFPLVYWDTGGYLMAAIKGEYEPNRSIFYARFVDFAGKPSAWGVAGAQSMLAASALGLAVRGFTQDRRALVLALGFGALSSLAWYAGWLMPDLFTGLALAITVALAFGRLGAAARAFLWLVLVFSMTVHTSHFPLVAGALAGAALGGWIYGARARWRAPAAAIAAAIALTVAANAALTGQAFFNRTGWVLLFARFAEGGLAQSALERRCNADPNWSKLCPVRNWIPNNAEQWLWSAGTPFWRLGDWDGTREDSRKAVLEAIAAEPMRAALFALDGFGRQVLRIRLGEGTESQLWFLRWTIEKEFPRELGVWENAHQQKGELVAKAAVANYPHMAVSLGALGLNFAALFLARAPSPLRAAAAAILLGLLANAFVCGALSGPHDRYGARAVWAALLTAAPLALVLWDGRKRSAPKT